MRRYPNLRETGLPYAKHLRDQMLINIAQSEMPDIFGEQPKRGWAVSLADGGKNPHLPETVQRVRGARRRRHEARGALLPLVLQRSKALHVWVFARVLTDHRAPRPPRRAGDDTPLQRQGRQRVRQPHGLLGQRTRLALEPVLSRCVTDTRCCAQRTCKVACGATELTLSRAFLARWLPSAHLPPLKTFRGTGSSTRRQSTPPRSVAACLCA